jgi:2-polyprenyl-6-methoxyphenol hydroxylase-like FAD-dependent oxidoreductase
LHPITSHPACTKGTAVEAPYDLLIGADGTQSAVRAAMVAADPAMTVEIADSGRE